MKRHHYTTNSERSSLSCQTYWLINYGLAIRPKATAAPLRKGTLWHNVLEAYWDAPESERLDAAYAWIDQNHKATLSQIQEERLTQEYTSMDEEECEVMHDTVGFMITEYNKRMGADNQRLELVSNEGRLHASTRTTRGIKSPVSRYAGRADKVLKDRHGQHWLMEHKTVTNGYVPEDWRLRNEYNPQTPTYAWMTREMTGIECVGVIFDVASFTMPPKASDWPMLSSGKGLAKKPPRGSIGQTLKDACRHHGVEYGSQDWHVEKYNDLKAREDGLMRREYVRFDEGIYDRTERELHVVSGQVRKLHRQADKLGLKTFSAISMMEDKRVANYLKTVHQQDPEIFASAVANYLKKNAHHFPRNPQVCFKYNRPCEFMNLCRHQSPDSVVGLVPKSSTHTELEDNNNPPKKEG